MPELHLKHPGFTYSTCGTFAEHREIIQRFKEKANLKHLYRNELDKASFAHDAANSDSEDLAKQTISDKIELMKFGYQRALASMVYTFLIRKKDQEQV